MKKKIATIKTLIKLSVFLFLFDILSLFHIIYSIIFFNNIYMFLFELFSFLLTQIEFNEEKNIHKPIIKIEEKIITDTIIKPSSKLSIKPVILITTKTIDYLQLKPYKDDLFKYIWWVLKTEYNNNISWIDYDVIRDIEDRDIIDVDRVYDKYVELIPDWFRNERSTHSPYWTQYYWEVKDKKIKDKDVEIVVLYFHWMWGDRHQWINDYTFGWIFNRIQNLMIKNNWVYISNDFTDFYEKWSIDMRIFLYKIRKEYPNAKIILSGASSGWTLIWNILRDEKMQDNIDWILLIGSVVFFEHNIYDNEIPIYIGHGTRDKNINYYNKYKFYSDLKNNNYNYPIKIEFFEGWVHWTPIRMVNWKENLNWILEENYKRDK